MEKYHAAVKFIELLQAYPDDFSAMLDTGRDHYEYVIKNKSSEVSIRIDSTDNKLSNSPQTTNDLMYVPSEELSFLVEWAMDYIEKDKIQKNIESDNKLLNTLLEYYPKPKG